ncbi:hypothetical protein MAR_007452 [Mya arenaria]|uniref:Uncharacterized protein n=1 Tax=Mya arenaria TaxID=6604 RepID=A0ABY7DBC5_MYAAR|nr:hypothetical protein MAR_007452 [Mya arenaria]
MLYLPLKKFTRQRKSQMTNSVWACQSSWTCPLDRCKFGSETKGTMI